MRAVATKLCKKRTEEVRSTKSILAIAGVTRRSDAPLLTTSIPTNKENCHHDHFERSRRAAAP